ncbi:MAG TPA: protein kinase [Pyrinomonadaceae bacterium]|nr:protein kinase [Pyrinomonadaceae bacterium]
MTPERWRQIDNLLQVTLECLPAGRAALLDLACSEDKNLRQEVESLLNFYEKAAGFLERPALEDAAELYCGPELTAGQLVGAYRMEAQLGVGGMGEVYLAEDTRLDRKVAIKFLPTYLEDDELARKRLVREAKAAAKLDHPNICAVYEVEEEADRSFIVMQYVAGRTLHDQIKIQPLQPVEALDVCIQIVEALAEAHSSEIVHRDIKPRNIMITGRGQIKVLDFGLAKTIDQLQGEQSDASPQSMLSLAGARPGTPPYMSPEQARGDPIDARSDLFAVGVILYECITGALPFSGDTNSEILSQVIHFHPPQPSKLNQNVPHELDTLVMKALQKELGVRYQSAVDLLEDLHALYAQLQTENRTPVQRLMFRVASAEPATVMYATGVALCLAVLVFFAMKSRFDVEPYRPSPEAMSFYDKGVMALRAGAYFEASKHLQQAINSDGNFAVAHARLAETLTELDYSDSAQKEIIRARSLASELSLEELDALYLKAITSTALREFSSAIQTYKQIESQTSDQAKANVYLDLGRAYENNDELEQARNLYQQVGNLTPQSPTAFLRLGIVCGKLQDYRSATDAFMKAEALYQALKNQEGITEVLYQRGFFFIDEGKPVRAREELENSIQMAKSTGNQHQLVRAMQALSSAFSVERKLIQAELQATEAIQVALNSGIQNQAVSGYIRLGDVFLLRGKPDEAKRQYLQALQIAQSFKMNLNEAWARRQVGSVLSLQHKTDEALSYVEPAAAFFQEHRYRKWLSQTLTLLGRIYRNKGDLTGALKVFKELKQLGEQLGDQSQVAMANFDIGTIFSIQEQYSEAFGYFDESYRIYRSLNAEIFRGYAASARASVLWQVGHSEEAKMALNEAKSIAEGPEGRSESLLADIYLVDALLKLSAGNYRECESESRQALELAGTEYLDVAIVAKQTMGLSRIRSGATQAGTRFCEQAVEMAKSTGSPQLLAGALLALAEASLENGQVSRALETALSAQQSLAHFGKADSAWRAWLVAAQASRRLRDENGAREYASRALSRLSELEQKEGPEAYNLYLQRFDIGNFHKQLNQLVRSQN